MSKQAAAAFKLTPVAPKPSAPPAPPPASTSSRLPPGSKSITCYPAKEGWLQLRALAGREDRTVQSLMLEAIDLLFENRELVRCAHPRRDETAA